MKFLKALIKTIKQMDEFTKNMFYGFCLLIFSLILFIPACIFDWISLFILICVSLGGFFVFKGFWIEDGREDFKRFISKIKNNM